jgi:hypothetical protein
MDTPGGAAADDHVKVRKGGLAAGGIVGALVLLVLLILTFVLWDKHNKSQKAQKGTWYATATGGNMVTGGNNPQWYQQKGNAGFGGSMDSLYNLGQGRVWGASAAGPDAITTLNSAYVNCDSGYAPDALGEARVLYEIQALDPAINMTVLDAGGGAHDLGVTAKGVDDNALMRLMQQGA